MDYGGFFGMDPIVPHAAPIADGCGFVEGTSFTAVLLAQIATFEAADRPGDAELQELLRFLAAVWASMISQGRVRSAFQHHQS